MTENNIQLVPVQTVEPMRIVACGFCHTFLLSKTNKMYAYGDATMGDVIQATVTLLHDFETCDISIVAVGRNHALASNGVDVFAYGANVC